MEPVTTQSDAIPAPTYTHSAASTGRCYWTRPAILFAIGDEPGVELSPLRSAMVATTVKAAETLASLDAMPDYAGSEPPHLAPLRQRTLNRMHRTLDMLGLPYEPPALPHGLEG
jgi:hypothetical protein